MRSRFVSLALAAILVAATAATAPVTLARFTDQDTSAHSFATDTLAPPTGLGATGGTSVSLSWTITPDTYATGYEVWRSTTSGSGYTLIKTVTPRTATTTTDAPTSSATYYYVLRSYFQNWRSVNSNQATAVVALPPVTTAQTVCTASAADTGGDNDGYETNTANACADDGNVASDAGSGATGRSAACNDLQNDRHRFSNFNVVLPGTVAAINGIQVQTRSRTNSFLINGNLCAELSWNGGTSWTAPVSLTVTNAFQVLTFGGPGSTWGRTWTAAELSNANFRVRLTDATAIGWTYYLDYVKVSVTYTP